MKLFSQKKSVKTAALLLACGLVVLAAPAGFTASANSAIRIWRGTYATGMLTTDKNCPVVVEGELLTFDLQEIPLTYGEESESNSAYGGKVTAQYTFYNPADYEVNVALAFPFGGMPYYYVNGDGGDYLYAADDTQKYRITCDGEEVERTLRYTYSDMDSFNTEKDLALLVDGFREHTFFTPDMPVKRYLYQISGTGYTDDDLRVSAEFFNKSSNEGIAVFSSDFRSEEWENNACQWFAHDGSTFEIFAYGASTEIDVNFNFYTDYSMRYPTNGNVSLIKSEDLTFKDLALYYYKQDYNVPESDWYNAVLDGLGSIDYTRLNSRCFDVKNELMRWYTYSLTIGPHERVVNEVTAPIYPDVNEEYSPSIYRYKYLLSPAASWADFGSLEIVINTPFYTVKESTLSLEKTDFGYTYKCEGLPETEFEFSLCESSQPKAVLGAWGVFLIIIMSLFILPVIIPIITLIVLLARRKKANKRT